ncbi:hypothetical protein BDZ94DRAFT_1247428 [Collybia nuda]|uniref:DUF4604 domain-containing protein n=1 Tax=Collybia nuda TaxID=64659 RepID=A0A9P5YGF6_9AGAR|nr:hypothetical protein BDZ94DRAFT_1247428 [Collybia nuda]
MAPKEPNRHQLSSRLSYSQDTPSFLLKLKNRIAGIPDEDEDYDDEFEDDGSGRPPIPRRPAIPERPEDDPGSADEDDGDEKPQVVVLRQGKHLTEREAENVRRSERGLPPIPDPTSKAPQLDTTSSKEVTTSAKTQLGSLSFSSTRAGQKSKATAGKRKAIGDGNEDGEKVAKRANNGPSSKKKPKKASKTLLSFGDDA